MSEGTSDHLQRFRIGEIEVVKVVDVVEPTSPRFLFVGRTRDDLDPHLAWLQPHFVDDKKALLLSIHSFVIRTRHHTVLVDTCVGDDKAGLVFPQWNGRQSGRYLAELAAARLRPEDIDYVFCTHMHLDHTGWNTRLRDGRWVPTFPAAKYVFNRREWAAWKDHPGAGEQAVVRQNVLPIIEADQVEWVDGAWEIDDQVALWPTPGHTPGHASVTLRSGGARAVITGDMLIHPVQIAEPDWSQLADEDKPLAIRTRTAFVESHGNRDVLVLGTHFNTPTGVYITERGGRRRVRLA
jgi:glyoxylase-like metal-dependent hydrolase (beta-lactamase superfamily II)